MDILRNKKPYSKLRDDVVEVLKYNTYVDNMPNLIPKAISILESDSTIDCNWAKCAGNEYKAWLLYSDVLDDAQIYIYLLSNGKIIYLNQPLEYKIINLGNFECTLPLVRIDDASNIDSCRCLSEYIAKVTYFAYASLSSLIYCWNGKGFFATFHN